MSGVRRFILAVLIVLGCSAAFAQQQLRIVTFDVIPFSYQENGVAKGVLYDVVAELTKRVGYSGQIEFLPIMRAAKEIQGGNNVLAFPVDRTAENEKQFSWVVSLYQDNLVVFSLSDSKVDISTEAAIKGLKIGVARGSPTEQILPTRGYSNLDVSPDEATCAKKLMLGRIDAWATGALVAKLYMTKIGETPEKLRSGFHLGSFDMYLAGSIGLDQKVLQNWRAAFETMKKDGTYSKLTNK